MKNILVLFVMISMSVVGFSQGAKVTSANNYLKQGELRKAKTAIDEASVHSKTGTWPKMWMYYGKIYYAIAIDTTAEYNDIRDGAIFKSRDGFLKVKEKPDSKISMQELYTYLYGYVYNKIYDDAVHFYNVKDFGKAAEYFGACGDLKATNEEVDTISYYYAANMAAANEDPAKSVEYFNKIKATGYEDGIIYSKLALQYQAMGDTTQAIATIKEGREMHPDNQALLISEFNLYVEMGETEKAIENIDKAIAANPNNAAYLDVRGKLKQQLDDLDGAEQDYLASIAIDPDQLDANYDLGALYVGQSILIVEELNNLPLNATKEYDAKKDELTKVYEKALPYLEKAYENEPSNKEVQDILIKLYLKTKQMDKYKKLQAEIEAQ